MALGPFSSPELIMELSNMGEGDARLTADGAEIFFTSTRAGGMGGRDIWTARRIGSSGPFGTPTVVVELNSTAEDIQPEVSANGLRMYFTSNRSGGSGLDVYITARATRTSPWSAPSMVAELSSLASDNRVSVSADDLLAVVDSARGASGLRELYLATRASVGMRWNTPAPISELDSSGADTNPSLTADALAIYYIVHSEIVVARRPDRSSPFAPPTPISELESAASESDPWISADERLILFTSDRSGVPGIYRATRP
jgi:Tol biopolymer transport system component